MKCALKFLLLVGVVGAAFAAWSVDVVEGNGVKASEERSIRSFSDVHLSGSGELVVVQADTPGLIVTADENLLEFVEAKVSGKTLHLRTRSGHILRSKTPIKYTLMAKQLSGVSVSGAGDATVEAWTGDKLTAKVSGAGNLTVRAIAGREVALTLSGAGSAKVSGIVKKMTAKVSGKGDIDASDLKADAADVQISGAGDISLWATDTLKARVSGAGEVKYRGSPTVDRKVSGAGSISATGE